VGVPARTRYLPLQDVNAVPSKVPAFDHIASRVRRRRPAGPAIPLRRKCDVPAVVSKENVLRAVVVEKLNGEHPLLWLWNLHRHADFWDRSDLFDKRPGSNLHELVSYFSFKRDGHSVPLVGAPGARTFAWGLQFRVISHRSQETRILPSSSRGVAHAKALGIAAAQILARGQRGNPLFFAEAVDLSEAGGRGLREGADFDFSSRG